MSCIMSNPRQLAALAVAAENLLNMGYEFAGYEASESMREALKGCADRYGFFSAEKIYTELHRLNARAYNGRYGRTPAEAVDPEPVDFPTVPRLVNRAEWIGGGWKVEAGHYKLLKLLDFYNYQIAEDATHKDALTKGLKEWEHLLCGFIVRNTQAYKIFGWGEV